MNRFKDTLIKILSLGIGLAIGIVLIAKVCFELSYDSFYKDVDRIYQIKVENLIGDGKSDDDRVAGAVPLGFQAEVPGVEYTTQIMDRTFAPWSFEDEAGNELFSARLIFADTSFFKMFSIPILAGDIKKTLCSNDYIAISHSYAEKLGGVETCLGKVIVLNSWGDKVNYIVEAVFEDLPANGTFSFDMVYSNLSFKEKNLHSWQIGAWNGYVRLQKGVDSHSLDEAIYKMQAAHQDLEKMKTEGDQIRYYLTPFDKLHTSDPDVHNTVIVLSIVAFLLLFISLMNYILVVLSSMVKRSKEIGVRKCYGAGSREIYGMLIKEAAVHIGLALVLAALLILAGSNLITNLLGVPFTTMLVGKSVRVIVAVLVFIFVLSVMVPGVLYTRVPVWQAIRNFSENKRRWKLGLLFAQFLLAAFFVNVLVVLGLQYNKMTNYNLGFDYQNTLAISLRGIPANEAERTVQELKRDPRVAGVSWAYQSLENSASGDNVINLETNEAYMNIANLFEVGDDFFEVMGIPIIEGKSFTPGLNDSIQTEIMVSRSFVERMREIAGWEGSGIGKQVFITSHEKAPTTIVGVYEDLKLGSFVDGTDHRPSVMYYGSVGHPFILRLYVRLHDFSDEAVNGVQQIVNQTMTTEQVTVMPMRMLVGNNYEGFKHVRNAVLLAGLSIFIIAMIGLIAYLMDEVNRRKSEIAIRKIVGATVMDVQRIFQRDLLLIAVPAMLIGLLLSWLVSRQVLQLFEVKIALTAWLFGGCTVAVLCLVLLVSAYLAWQASRANPTENLRTE